MATKINEFIASLVDASIPEEQQSFLLTSTDGNIQGGDNIEGTCVNHDASGCTGTNNKCTNYGGSCLKGKNTSECANHEDNRLDKNDACIIITLPIEP